jgi:diacylglycerol kinase
MKRIQELKASIHINPQNYAYKVSESRRSSFWYAVSGISYMIRWQKNIRILALITPIVVGVAFWLGITSGEWATLVVMMTLVWLAEFFNASIEAVVDLAAQKQLHPLAKVSKDVAAGAVLLASLASIIVGLLLFLERFLEKLGF